MPPRPSVRLVLLSLVALAAIGVSARAGILPTPISPEPATTPSPSTLAPSTPGTTPVVVPATPAPPTATTTPTGRPSGQTRRVLQTTSSGATLAARINPRGQPSTFWFEYGPTSKYGRRSPIAPAGSGTVTVALSIPVGGLEPATRYHYRVIVRNASGTTRGRRHTFKTERTVTGVEIGTASRYVVHDRFGLVEGIIGGAGTDGLQVALMRQDFPYDRPYRQVATQTTAGSGAYRFAVGPLRASARFQVVTLGATPLRSPEVTLHGRVYIGAPRITGRRSTAVRLSGGITPAVPSGRVAVQRRSPKGRWVTIQRTRARAAPGNRSSYRTWVPRTGGTPKHRVVVDPRDDGGHVKTRSPVFTVPAR